MKGSCSSATVHTRRPSPASRALPGRRRTGKSDGNSGEGPGAAGEPGRGGPADAAAAAPGCSLPRCGGAAGSAGLCGSGTAGGRSVPGSRRRRAAGPAGGSRAGGAAVPRAAASRGWGPSRGDSRQGSAGAPRRGRPGWRPPVLVPAGPGGSGAAPLRRSSSCRTRRWRWAAAAPST